MSAPEAGQAAPRRCAGKGLGAGVLALGLVLSAFVLAKPLRGIRDSERSISATGSAVRPARADLVVWTVRVKATAADLAAAYDAHARSAARLRAFLLGRGFDGAAVSEEAVQTQVLKKEWGSAEIQGYELSQAFKVSTTEIDSALAAVREAALLLREGVLLDPESPQFHFTGLDALKPALIADAARNARERAEAVAAATGVRIGDPRSVRIGVFQVRPAHSTDVSDAGMLDTTSLEKEVMGVVTVKFAIR